MQILKNIGEELEYLLLIVIVAILSMIVHALTSSEPARARSKSAIAGGVIAMILSYPTWVAIGDFYEHPIPVYWLIPITFVYTITGQFIPDALKSIVPKMFNALIKKFFKDKTGEDLK